MTTPYHDAIREFKRGLIERKVKECGGNRTHAAASLGLQRTYMLRLIRDLNISVPPGRRGRTAGA